MTITISSAPMLALVGMRWSNGRCGTALPGWKIWR